MTQQEVSSLPHPHNALADILGSQVASPVSNFSVMTTQFTYWSLTDMWHPVPVREFECAGATLTLAYENALAELSGHTSTTFNAALDTLQTQALGIQEHEPVKMSDVAQFTTYRYQVGQCGRQNAFIDTHARSCCCFRTQLASPLSKEIYFGTIDT